MPPEERRELVRRAIAVALWLALLFGLVPLGNRVAPLILSPSVIAATSLQTFLMVCQIATLVLGLGASLLLLRDRREGLGFKRFPTWSAAASTVLSVPLVFVVSSYVALQIALPTLMEELRTRGAGASAQNAGEFGRALTQAPLLVTLLWGALLGALGEELFFRGLLWGAITGATRHLSPRAKAPERPLTMSQRVVAILVEGGIATLLSAALFGWMHKDLPGGVGIVRIVSTTCLGLASGIVRQATGGVVACVLLHATYNTLVIGAGRKWFASAERPILEGIPNALVTWAIVGGVGALAVVFVRALVERRARSTFVAEE